MEFSFETSGPKNLKVLTFIQNGLIYIFGPPYWIYHFEFWNSESAGPKTPKYQILLKSIQILHFWIAKLNVPFKIFWFLKFEFQIWNQWAKNTLNITTNDKMLFSGNNPGLKGLKRASIEHKLSISLTSFFCKSKLNC